MTDYVLATGTTRASAARAPEHMAAWLEAHGYRIVRTPGNELGGEPNSSTGSPP